MMKTKILIGLCFSICCLMMTASGLTAQDKEKPRRETFSALAYLPRGAGTAMIGAGATANVNININGYSTDEETQQLAQVLLDGGNNALVKALQKVKSKGKVSLTGRVGTFDLKLIRSRPTETGRRIIGVSDRPIGFLEAYRSGRSVDYKVGILDLQLKTNDKGKEEGEGVLMYAAKVKVLEGNTIQLEHYSIDPIQLRGVHGF